MGKNKKKFTGDNYKKSRRDHASKKGFSALDNMVFPLDSTSDSDEVKNTEEVRKLKKVMKLHHVLNHNFHQELNSGDQQM